MDISVVVPMYNEEANVEGLITDVIASCDGLGRSYEVICVNDGSADATADRLDVAAARYPQLKVIHFSGNYGQTPAMAAGLEASTGDVILMMDGDRQNDPADFSRLLEKLDEGYDLVSGWRKDRKDSEIRKVPSRIANRLIGRITGVRLHDYGCSLKAYRRGFLDPADVFGEMHRFFPVYVAMNGGRVAELVVKHHPRTAGVSKYGLNRIFRVLADLLLVHLLQRYATRPLHYFAKVAQWCVAFAGTMFVLAVILGIWAPGRPFLAIPILAGMIAGVGAMLSVGLGLVAEYAVRARYTPGDKRPWLIKRTVNLDPSKPPG